VEVGNPVQIPQVNIMGTNKTKIKFQNSNLVLNTDPGEWAKNPTFAAYLQPMAALKATNNGAERGIALV
jgi:hypothetical protein